MQTITNQILFDKYQVLRPLGTGSTGTVYLVRHLSLDQERAMKIYPKDPALPVSTLTEARILKSLSHPGIPLIYDLENDAHYYYLIEEYVSGESLDQFLLHQSVISTDFFYMLCGQLCDIFTYLHRLSPCPILYRDLKPEHMILSGMQIRLIDFNISFFYDPAADGGANNADRLGNERFSAPENFTESRITLSSDIYSIGKIMEYLSDHLEHTPSKGLRKIIHQAASHDPTLRFETVEALHRALQDEQNKQTKKTHLVRTIAVTGCHYGCGTTHLAISLVSTLNFLGITAVYHEKNSDRSLQNAAEIKKGFTEREGCLYHFFFRGVPNYGPGIQIPCPDARVRILDYGPLCESLLSTIQSDAPDLIIYVTSGGVWKIPDILSHQALLKTLAIPCEYLCSFSTLSQAKNLSRLLKEPICRYPADPDPFLVTPSKLRFFRRLKAVRFVTHPPD